MVAALYVERGGIYYGLPDVDPWDEQRDARRYVGPWPVVAHPPCARWSIMGGCRPEYQRGDDGGCFAAAVAAVRSHGGVLEHPRHSFAWPHFALPRPPAEGWARTLFDEGWACEVDQRRYGHRARKPTWLYYVGPEPPPMLWGAGAPAELGRFGNPVTTHNNHGDGRLRSATPPAFRDALIALAATVA